ncbi:hypothetical protein [Tychonema sp. BBK16]|uniref:hypothetical protein n=1 Tax=Tychonema sp. BBK16 TaxID=2699888 RepID=UPI001F36AB26|nr:hypothetical protein [Tychonema sp. BBK16]MCF6373922.1 hypothetical protein [Tychonema sp. BBK16]
MNPNDKKVNLSRRNSIKFAAGAIGTGILAARVGADVVAPEPAIAQNDLTPDAAMEKLMDGNKRFVDRKRQSPNQSLPRLAEVAKSQKPFAAILGCADSRFPSEIIFDQRLKASPVISKLIEENKLKVIGGYYDLDTGAVNILVES